MTPVGENPAGKNPAGKSSGPASGRNPFDPSFADLPQTIPIFPLPGVLLLPGGKLPLNIFEPRYLAMVRAALAGPRLIGMIQPRDPDAGGTQPEVQKVGCAGRIVSFAESDDGRYLITLSGICRFSIMGELPLMDGFRRVVADWSAYAGDLNPGAPAVDRTRLIGALRAFFADQPVRIDWQAIEQTADDRLVVSLAMICPFEAAEKQILLEAPSPSERARVMIALLESAAHTRGEGSVPPVRH
jgi:Lon protease-like protein